MVGEGNYLFSAGNGQMETTTTTTNTINSQYEIREGAEFSLGAVMDVTESSHDGEVDAINQVKPILLL